MQAAINKYHLLEPGQVDIWVVNTAELAVLNDAFLRCLSNEDCLRLQRYTNVAARNMFLISRGALRMLLAKYLGFEPARIMIATHEHGKPFLTDHPQFFFNLSHSRNIALIAFALFPVGVDVEYVKRQIDFAAVMQRFFSESERADWSANCVPSPQEAFFRGWTRKEALLKATGEGIAGLGHTQISFLADQPRALILRNDDYTQSQNWLFKDFCPAADYQAAAAYQSPALQLNIRHFMPEFYEKFSLEL